MTQRKRRTANLPVATKRAQIRDADGNIIYTGPERIGNTFAPFNEITRNAILKETGSASLKLGSDMHDVWWQSTFRACCGFVSFDSLENLAYPTTKQLDDFIKSASAFKKHIKPLLDVDGNFDTGADCALIYADQLVKIVESGGFRKPLSKKVASLHLVRALGGLYLVGFNKKPGSGPTGPFVRFVRACVNATEWHGQPPSADIIQSHVRTILKGDGFRPPLGLTPRQGGN